MANVDLATKLEMITDYYGAGTIWDRMSIDGLSADQINAMYNSLPASSFSIDRTPDGTILGRNYTNPFELPVTPGTDFDSNIPGGSYSGGNTFTGNVPANIDTDPISGLPVRQTAGPKTTGGINLPAIADKVSLAVMGVNIGAKLGIGFDSLLYNAFPDFWDTHLPTLNPETWNSLVGQSPVGDFFLRTLFGITGNNMTGYVNQDVLAYYYQMLRDAGLWDTSGDVIYTYNDAVKSQLTYPNSYPSSIPCMNTVMYTRNKPSDSTFPWIYTYTSTGAIATNIAVLNADSVGTVWYGREPFEVTLTIVKQDQTISTTTQRATTKYTYKDIEYYYLAYGSGNITYSSATGTYLNDTYWRTLERRWADPDVAYIIFKGDRSESETIPGTTVLPSSTQYPPTNITGTTTQDVLNQLRQEYPDLFTDAVTEKTLQDDGTVTETTYVPIPWVTTGIDGDEKTTDEGKTQDDTQVDEETSQQILPQTQQDEPTQPPDTGDGSAPVPVVPTGSASSLWAVYNPTQGQLNSFGAWLWSSDFVEQLKKLFADPMQAIIGVHKVFATPSTGGSQTIKCGYLDSGVSAAVVTNQYTTVDCGSASLREYFGNVFDYDPFTKVSIFLPFIGIVPLNTSDVMRATISVKYKVDVITGACLAEVSVSRDGGGGILYTYGGSAIVTYPISSGSYVGAVQAALSTAIGIGSAIATGGASLGASAGMVLGGLSHAKTQVQHSGQFSGCSGAMGGKKPYLIISRPQTRTPQRIAEYEGIPTNSIHQLSNCSGFTKVKEVHVVSTTAYDNEIQEIESLLKTGVIF